MRRAESLSTTAVPPASPAAAAGTPRSDWHTLARLLPYLWAYKGRVVLALACLIASTTRPL